MQPPTLETILTAFDLGVFTITLNRPEVLNAVNERLTADLGEALRFAERSDQVRCVILTGAGRGFCSGQDLRDRAPGDAPYGESLRRRYNPIILKIRHHRETGHRGGQWCGRRRGLQPGAGRRFEDRVRQGLVHRDLLAHRPDPRLGRDLPPAAAGRDGQGLELAWTADPVDAAEALRLGLVNRVAPHDQLMGAAMELARRLAEGPTRGYGLTKRGFNTGLASSLEAALEYEAHLQSIAGQTADHQEGVTAFFEKRQPRFGGR